jgi:hypothetical protein
MERVSCWSYRYLHKSYFAVIPAGIAGAIDREANPENRDVKADQKIVSSSKNG